MTTAADLLTESFMLAGIDSPTTVQTSSAFNSLNNMISFYGIEDIAYAVVSESTTLTVGTTTYTIGSSGTINTVRPIRIANCFLRDGDTKDYPVQVMSPKDYNNIFDKSYSARPTKIYYNPEYPLGKIIFNKKPDYAYTAYFEFHKPLTEYAYTTTTFASPPEYKEFLIYNIAVKIAEKWDRTMQKSVYIRADETKSEIQRLNSINRPVPESRLPIVGSTSIPERNILTDALIDEGVF